MTRNERIEYIKKIKAHKKPPTKDGDPYTLRDPWPVFGSVADDGYTEQWEWYEDSEILANATNYEIALALCELGESRDESIDFEMAFEWMITGGHVFNVKTGDEYRADYCGKTRKYTIYKNNVPQLTDANWNEIFTAKYWRKIVKCMSGMTFSEALEEMKNGKCVRRAAWGDTGYYYRIRKSDYPGSRFGEVFENSDGVLIVSISTDLLLANDWEICNTNKGV